MLTSKINAALSKTKADIVFKNAHVVDIFCHRILTCDVAVSQGYIVGLGSYDGNQEIEATNQYLMPSFIDSHIHIESSMLCPDEYAKIVAPKGVTTIIADPHEIANVCGEDGLIFMLQSAKNVPVDIHYMLPSCVPATPFDQAGAEIDALSTVRLFQKYDFLGLGEMMNYPGVLALAPEVLAKLKCSDIIDGHAPLVSGKELNAYLCAGIHTDHESTSPEELTEKISKGMYIQIREGTQAQNLKELIKGLTPYTLRRLLFCSDDRYLGDIIDQGSISNCIGKAVSLGIDPLDAITIASFNAAECYGLKNKGAIAPGYRADLVLSADLAAQNILAVYKDGQLIAQNGQALFDSKKVPQDKVLHTVHIPSVTPNTFDFYFTPGSPAIQVFPQSLYTKQIRPSSSQGLNLCAVIERHGGNGEIGQGFIAGFDLHNGAIAQTIGHDAHNITVIGDNPEDMALAVNALGTEGGMTVVCQGVIQNRFLLPIAGLMSDKPAQEVLQQHQELLKAVQQLSINPQIDPFMLLSFLSLLVIPDIKLSHAGLFDVNTMCFIS